MNELIGPHVVKQAYIGAGAGGDRTLLLEPPYGEIWIVKMLTALHSGVGALAVQWYVRDNIASINMMGPYNPAVAGSLYEWPWPFAADTAGPLVLSSGCFRVHCTFYAAAAGEDLWIKGLVQVLKGVVPLL